LHFGISCQVALILIRHAENMHVVFEEFLLDFSYMSGLGIAQFPRQQPMMAGIGSSGSNRLAHVREDDLGPNRSQRHAADADISARHPQVLDIPTIERAERDGVWADVCIIPVVYVGV